MLPVETKLRGARGTGCHEGGRHGRLHGGAWPCELLFASTGHRGQKPRYWWVYAPAMQLVKDKPRFPGWREDGDPRAAWVWSDPSGVPRPPNFEDPWTLTQGLMYYRLFQIFKSFPWANRPYEVDPSQPMTPQDPRNRYASMYPSAV